MNIYQDQLTSNGQYEVDVHTNLLGVGRRMKKLQNIITPYVKEVVDEVLKENIKYKTKASKKCKITNKPLLSICCDIR